MPQFGRRRLVAVPYSALIYTASGKTFTYVQTAPLTYVHKPVHVADLTSSQALLSSGPAPGAAVVTVGPAHADVLRLGRLAPTRVGHGPETVPQREPHRAEPLVGAWSPDHAPRFDRRSPLLGAEGDLRSDPGARSGDRAPTRDRAPTQPAFSST